MKILYIITQADGGGAQQYVLSLAKHFGGDIACGDEKTNLFDEARKLGIPENKIHKLKHLKRNIHLWHDWLAIFEIRDLVKKLQPDIAHLNSTKAGFLGSIGAKLASAKVVFTAHGFRYLEPLSYSARKFYLAIEKLAGNFRDYIIAVSDADKKSALKNNLISPDKITTIHNGIPKINFLSKEEARRALGLPTDKKITVIIANDYKTKGLDTLEKAAFISPVPGSLTVVIGEVSETKQSNENITYLGYKKNASRFLKAFDGTMIPSLKEGFPFVALEALQAGQPIIATDVGGIHEALGDAGQLIPPNDPKALAEARKSIITDDQKAKMLSQKALERAQFFTEEKMFEETKKVYEKILKN